MSEQYDRITLDDLQRHERWLRKLAFELTRSNAAAEDLLQDTYLAVLKRPPQRPRHDDEPGAREVHAYLAGMVRNIYRMWVRSDVRRERREAFSSEPTGELSPESAIDARWTGRVLLEEIERLAEPYRSTLLMRYYDGLKPNEIARRLGVPAATVRKRSQLGLERLRQRLDRRGHGDRDPWVKVVARGALVPALPRLWRGLSTPARALLASTAGKAALIALATLTAVWALPRFTPLRFPGGVAASETQAHKVLVAPVRVPALHSSVESLAEAGDSGFDEADVGAGAAGDFDHDQPNTAPSRSDGAAGRPGCPRLSALVDAAKPGSTVRVPACIYREKVVIMKPLSLIAEAGAELRGSDVWARFEARRAGRALRHVSLKRVPLLPDPTRDCVHRPDGPCEGPEQVFIDGRPLRQVGARTAALAPDDFLVDEERRIVLARSPDGHVVEVTTRLTWISIAASDVLVQGFRMRHAASDHYAFSVINPFERVHIVGNRLSDTSGPLMTVAGNDHRVEQNELWNAGGAALRIEPGAGTVVRGNRIHHSGPNMDTPGRDRSWQTGGVMTILHPRAAITDNDIFENRGFGVFVLRGDETHVMRNRIHDNTGGAIAFQQLHAGRISENRLWQNGHGAQPPEAGIFSVSTHAVAIDHNILAFHPFGIGSGPLRRADLPAGFDTCKASAENHISHNVFIDSGDDDGAIQLSGDPRDAGPIAPCASNILEQNLVWTRGPAAARPEHKTGLARSLRRLDALEKDAQLSRAGIPIR